MKLLDCRTGWMKGLKVGDKFYATSKTVLGGSMGTPLKVVKIGLFGNMKVMDNMGRKFWIRYDGKLNPELFFDDVILEPYFGAFKEVEK